MLSIVIISILNFTDILLLGIGIGMLILFLYSFILSAKERERKASLRFLLTSVILPLPIIMLALSEFPYQDIISFSVLILIIVSLLVLFFPINRLKNILIEAPKNKIDERNIMFSRRLLKEGTIEHKEYYLNNPEKLISDNKFRKQAGLLSKDSTNFDPLMFASSNASFYTVEQLASAVNGKPVGRAQEFNKDEITYYIKKWAQKLGVDDIGITELKDYHKYSHTGRGKNYGERIVLKHKYAIAFTVEMDFDFTSAAPYAPTVMESGQQYLHAGIIAVQLAEFIRNLGHEARAHIDANYQVVCPLVAKDAGLGELGRMGLLMTPKLGPRVRLGVVTTDLPITTNKKTEDKTVIDFCNICKKCADVCPSNSISMKNRKEIDGVNRWQIDQESCFHYWCISGTDCGRCLATCPYSHPNNFLHNFVRAGMKNNFFFRRFALKMDDVFYGKKPHPKPALDWMKVKSFKN